MKKTLITLTALFLVAMAANAFGLTLFSDSFDSNPSLTGWKRSSTSYVTRITSGYKIGTAAMRINGAYNAVTYINTLPFKNIQLSFKMAASSLASGNTMEAWADYGTGYVKIATLTSAQATGAFQSFTVAIPQGSASFKIMFKLVTTSTSRYGYVDDIVLTGDRK